MEFENSFKFYRYYCDKSPGMIVNKILCKRMSYLWLFGGSKHKFKYFIFNDDVSNQQDATNSLCLLDRASLW